MRILIADNNVTVRRSIRRLLSERPEWSVCGEAVDGFEAVDKARELRPDVAMIDVAIPRMNGLEAARIIQREFPQTKIVILSQNDPVLVRQQEDDVHADAYVPKSELSLKLLPAIEEVMRVRGGLDSIFPGESEMARLMREVDWSGSKLGPPQHWPDALKTSVRIILTSRHPMFVWWGDDLINLYNDGYARFLLSKHPRALAKPAVDVWPEIWDDVIVPRVEFLKHEDTGTYDEAMAFVMHRRGFPEETYATFSYSPILNDDGRFGGILCPVTEDTERIRGQRQMALLRELAARTPDARNRNEACLLAANALQTDKDDVLFAVIYELNIKAGIATLQAAAGVSPEGPAAPKTFTLGSNLPWPLRDIAAKNRSIVVSDLTALSGYLPNAQRRYPVTQAIILQLAYGSNDTKVALVVGLSPLRPLDDNYREFLDLIAAGVSSALQNADAYEAEKRRAEALAEIDRAKTAFFSNVSHEFRTPLTLLLGPLEDVLAQPNNLTPQQRESLGVSHRNALRLLKLVNTLLDFSRIEAGRIQAVFEPTTLAEYTAELASIFRSAIERAGLQLIVDCPPLSNSVYVDREMWEKIVLNLLSNAFKFTFVGAISVSLRQTGEMVELTVKDTGTGIPASEVPHLFERFHRVKGARGRFLEGSGIGLALVQELVKLHGGAVRVESEIDRGSAFTVMIPLGDAHLPADRVATARPLTSTALRGEVYVEEVLRWIPEMQHQDLGTRSGEQLAEGMDTTPHLADLNSRPRILLADDNADMREYVRRLLSAHYQVDAVTEGLEALNAARERIPDLVLTDIMMPRLDGFGLLKQLRADERLKSVPVILLSARAGEEASAEGIESGADDYLVKPFSARQLLARVGTHIKLARTRQAVEKTLRDNEERLRGLVAEREALLKEVHHRVKNNLQVIISLLEMQARQVAHDPAVFTLFEEARNRVMSISTMHELLYRSSSFAEIDLAAYARDLVAHLVLFYRVEDRVAVSVFGNGISVPLETAVPYGLLLNELLSNVCKHAFPGSSTGKVTVSLEKDDKKIRLKITDNGIGLPEHFDPNKSPTLGLQLVYALAEQLDGDIHIYSDGGTVVEVCMYRTVPVCEG
jgi:signal transduction histidine kinase